MDPIANDLCVLRNYNFFEATWGGFDCFNNKEKINRKNNTVLLGVRNGALINVQTKDINCWNLFLRLFGKGVLAHTHISLKSLVKYLEQYNWKALDRNDKAFENVIKVAYRNFNRNDWVTRFSYTPSKLLREHTQLTHTIHGRFYLNHLTTARDLHLQLPQQMQLIKIDSAGVESNVHPKDLINSQSAAQAICVRDLWTHKISTAAHPRPYMSRMDYRQSL